jgi:hypothetical protein
MAASTEGGMALSNGGKTFPRSQVLEGKLPSRSKSAIPKNLSNMLLFNQLEDCKSSVTGFQALDNVAEGLRLGRSPFGIHLDGFKLLILKGIETDLKSDLANRRKAPMAVACLTGVPCKR